MAAIQPASQIVLYENVPFDNTYTDTLYSENVQEQINWFNQYAHHTFNALTYQRHTRNTCRIQATADDLYNVNYMIFSNPAYGTKRFFAFVTAVEYINNVTTEITYELDVMQTYFHDYTLEPCFVEREHTSDDTIGHNIATEPVDLGPIKCTDKEIPYDWFNDMSVVVCHANNEAADAGSDAGSAGDLTITRQPHDVTLQSGSGNTVTLVCVAENKTEVVSYQWQIWNKTTTAWVTIDGATGSQYEVSVASLKQGDDVRYRCHVTDSGGGSIYSNVATITREYDFSWGSTSGDKTLTITPDEGTGKTTITVNFSYGGVGLDMGWRWRQIQGNKKSSWTNKIENGWRTNRTPTSVSLTPIFNYSDAIDKYEYEFQATAAKVPSIASTHSSTVTISLTT